MGNVESHHPDVIPTNPNDPMHTVYRVYHDLYDILMNISSETIITPTEKENFIFQEFKHYIRSLNHDQQPFTVIMTHPKYGTLFHLAAAADNGKVIQYLVDIISKDTTLFESSSSLSSSMNTNTTTNNNNNNSMLTTLLNTKNKDGSTCTFLAVQNNCLKALEVLVSLNNIDINLPCLSSSYSLRSITPLYLAVTLNQPECVTLLLQHINIDITGKSTNIVGNKAYSLPEENVLTMAKKLEYDQIVQILESKFTMNVRRSNTSSSTFDNKNNSSLSTVYSYTTDAIEYPSVSHSSDNSNSSIPSTSSNILLRNKNYTMQPNELLDNYLQRIMKECQTHKEQGRYEVAINLYSLLLQEYKENDNKIHHSSNENRSSSSSMVISPPDIYFARAACLQLIGQIEAAMQDYELALNYLLKDNRIVEALYKHAQCLLSSNGNSNNSNTQNNSNVDSLNIPSSNYLMINPTYLRKAINDLELALRLARAQEHQQNEYYRSKQNNNSLNQSNNSINKLISTSHIQQLLTKLELALETIDTSYIRKIPSHEKTYYQLLKIPINANDTIIKQAYRQLSLAYHPDKYTWAEPSIIQKTMVKIRRINEAYEVLSDPTRRAFYDLELTAKQQSE